MIVTKRSKNSNLRRRFKKIVGRAGLQPWPKLFQNMRASRATELVKDFPEHVVTAWMGHSKRIAQKHYLQVTEDDYKQASSNPTQNPTQQITVSPRRGSQPILSAHEKTLVLQGLAIIRETLQTREVGDEGLEAFGSYPLFNRIRPVLVKQLGAHTGAELPLSQVVALLIERWDYMTPEEQEEIMSRLLSVLVRNQLT